MAYGIVRVAAAAATAVAVAGCGAAPGGGSSQAHVAAELRGSPPALATLHRQASRILGGGLPAFRARLRALRGFPVVVMQWSSYCDGCAADLRYFRAVSAALGTRVAFVGVDVQDGGAAARSRLAAIPESFPSYADHDRTIAASVSREWSQWTPVTYLDTAHGVQRVFAGPFLSAASLRRWIRRGAGV